MPENAAPAPKPGRVLVVDDEAPVLAFLRRAISDGPYVVEAVDSGEQALALLQVAKPRFDVLLSDVNMPGMSGLDLLTHCKSISPDTEVILLTGKPELEDAVSTIKHGACDYLSKPIEIQKLRERVSAALERSRKTIQAKANAANEQLGKTVALDVDQRPPAGFHVVRTIGAGNMGVVMLVEKDGGTYAMKILRSRGDEHVREMAFKRFLREAEVLSRIDHPGVVKLIDYGLDPKTNFPFILMEFVPGKPLNQFVGEGGLDLVTKVSLIRQIADALDAVHRYGILHRDVKPSNVIVTESFRTKLTDFGIARLGDSSLTMTGELLGSPAYMAPERFESQEVDHRADIFALGVLGYELLVGQRPFSGETFCDLMRAISTEAPPDPRTLNAALPSVLCDELLFMLEKKPRSRCQSAAQVVQVMDRVQQELSQRLAAPAT